MDFVKYQHVEKFGTSETEGIDIGTCYIFPKIDGTNGQLWWDDRLMAGSRNRILSIGSDNAGFYDWASNNDIFFGFFKDNKNLRLYGEWLVPHTLKTYQDNAWKRFYVFDVCDENGVYLDYNTYSKLLEPYNIQYIPPICVIKNPTIDRIMQLLEENTFLIKDGNGVGEGIVIKNYDFRNKFGRTVWGKVVRNEFKAKHARVMPRELTEKRLVEDEIVNKYVTQSLVEKEFSKIENDGGWNSKQIPRLLNTVYYCLVKEESWNYVKEFKNPTIDYKKLLYFSNNKIKELKPDIF